MKRLNSLDYLRGIAAMAILLYHYCSWTFGQFDSASFLGRIGIYGVALFYILSGLTFQTVYSKKWKPTWRWNAKFYSKRVLRIFPVLWLATFAHLLFIDGPIDPHHFALNLSGLFAFVSWDHYFATGAWSIGNELVFYTLLPILFWSSRRSMRLFSLVLILFGTIYCVFAFQILNPNIKLSEQWHHYTNPLNQAFLFVGGYALGRLYKRFKLGHQRNILVLAMGIGIFIWFPVEGNKINLVCGFPRLMFTFSCFMIVWGARTIEWKAPSFARRSLSKLGHISFSLYLLHPLVFEGCDTLFGPHFQRIFGSSAGLNLLFATLLSLVVSSLTYHFIELPFIQLGKHRLLRKQALNRSKTVVSRNGITLLKKRITSFRLW